MSDEKGAGKKSIGGVSVQLVGNHTSPLLPLFERVEGGMPFERAAEDTFELCVADIGSVESVVLVLSDDESWRLDYCTVRELNDCQSVEQSEGIEIQG